MLLHDALCPCGRVGEDAASFSDAPRAAQLLEDQRRTAGDAGAAAAATVAARIELRAAVKAREQGSLGSVALR